MFARWSWSGGQLVVVNDRYGFHPLFYWAKPGSIAISPSVVTLLEAGAPRDLDDAAIAAFLRLGSYLGDDTPFESIRAVPPGATFTWSASRGLEVAGSYVLRGVQLMPREQALTAFSERFREAVRRRLCPGDEIVHPLTGGRDSRHILLELCELGAKPSLAVTARHYPPKWREDIEIASIVARRLGVTHRVLEQEPQAQAESEKNVDTCFLTDRNGWAIAIKRVLEERRACLFDGIAGGILSAGSFLGRDVLDLFDAGEFAALSRRVCRRGRDGLEPFLERLLSAGAYRRFGYEAGYQRIEDELRRHADAPNPVSSFYFWNRTRRDVALTPFGIFRGHRVLAPYVDHDVYDLLAALPASLFLDGRFHTDALLRAHPRYADIPFASERHNRLENRPHYRRFSLDLLARAARRGSLAPLRVSRVGPSLLATAVTGNPTGWLGLLFYLVQLNQVADGAPISRKARFAHFA